MQENLQRERFFRRINLILIPIYSLVGLYAVYSGYRAQNTYVIIQGSLALLMLAGPGLLSLAIHAPVPQDCRMLYYFFVFCTVLVGSAFYGYSRIPYWDKIFHLLSGVLLSAVGLVVCQLVFPGLEGTQKLRGRLASWFVFLWNMTVAVLWEIYEYALLVFLGLDAVNHRTTGVHDTMQDMIVCLVGGLFFLGSLRRYLRQGKRSFLLNTCFHLFAMWEKPMWLK